MSINEMESKARELRELQALIDEATAEAEALKDALKAAMGDAEEVRAGAYKITWKAVTSARIDTGALRKAVQDELRRCKYVKSFRLGVYGEGEDGVTIAEFK